MWHCMFVLIMCVFFPFNVNNKVYNIMGYKKYEVAKT